MSGIPAGWEMKTTPDGKTYYVDHNTRQTHWTLPAGISAAPVMPQTPMMNMPTPVPQATVVHVQHTPGAMPSRAEDRAPLSSTAKAQQAGAICTQDLMRRANEEEAIPSEKYHLQSSAMLEIQLDGRVFCRKGAMTAYRGKIKFEKGSGASLSNKLLKMATGEGPSMMKATGKGRLFLSDYKKDITILKLSNESIIINGNDILCWDDGMEWKVTMMKGASGMLSGGLFNVKIKGTGHVCFTTHGTPLVMVASKTNPLVTDPQATVAWSGNLDPSLKTDVSFKSFIGKGSGEELSMRFEGPKEGYVIVQPFEEHYQAA